MSVVNEMLRELDRRQAGDARRIFGQHLRQSGGHGLGRWAAIAVGGVAIAGASLYALQDLDFAKAAPAPLVKTAPAPLVKTAPAPLVAAVPQSAPAREMPVSIATPVAAAQAEPSKLPAVAATASPRAIVASSATSLELKQIERPSRLERAAKRATQAPAEPKIDKHFRDGPAPSAEGEFRRAAALIEQGRMGQAAAALRSVLAMDPRHEAARQALAVVLLEASAVDDAESVLAEGLRLNPRQTNFALVLARLKLDRGEDAAALTLLREHGGAAADDPQYRALVAALLQRLGRHGEAIDEYQAVLKLAPSVGVWWIGLGLSQEGADRSKDAAEAFRRAKASGNLSPDLMDFVERKLQTARQP